MRKKEAHTDKFPETKWLVFDILSAMFRGRLPLFQVGPRVALSFFYRKSNTARIQLWEFLQTRIKIQHRDVEQIVIHWGKVISGDDGVSRRSVECDVTLRVKDGVPLPLLIEPRLVIRICVHLLADGVDWHVSRVCFIPMKGQTDSLYQGAPLEYGIVS